MANLENSNSARPASAIAHDINNLLVGVLGNAELILGGGLDEATTRACLMDIRDSARGAAELCESLRASQ